MATTGYNELSPFSQEDQWDAKGAELQSQAGWPDGEHRVRADVDSTSVRLFLSSMWIVQRLTALWRQGRVRTAAKTFSSGVGGGEKGRFLPPKRMNGSDREVLTLGQFHYYSFGQLAVHMGGHGAVVVPIARETPPCGQGPL